VNSSRPINRISVTPVADFKRRRHEQDRLANKLSDKLNGAVAVRIRFVCKTRTNVSWCALNRGLPIHQLKL